MPGSKERQRRRAREHYERQRAKRIARQRKIRKWTLTGLIIAMVGGLAAGLSLTFIGGGTPKASAKPTASATATPSASPTASTIAEPAHHCTYTSSAAAGQHPSLPLATPDWAAAYTATINTNRGPIVIKLANSTATCAVNSFVHLAQTNFWNSTQCHRVSDAGGLYMLQCGDPTAKASATLACTGNKNVAGSGGPSYTFPDESLKGATYPAGTLAMANSGPNTNGSQFFLVFKNTSLPASYTPFGTITSGLAILQNVGKAGTTCTYPGAGGGVPKEKVIINSVSIKKT